MGNRLIFLYLVLLEGGTEKAMLAGRRLSRFKRVAGFPGKSGKSRLRRDDEALRAEATNALLPGKASKHQVTSIVPQTDTGGQVENTKALERTG